MEGPLLLVFIFMYTCRLSRYIQSESVIRVRKKATETLEFIVSFYVRKTSKEKTCSETHFSIDELLDNVDICE